MPRNVYFSQGTANEQYLLEDIIIESMQIYGQDFYYIPRSLVAHDQILGEDRLSEFKDAYQIEMYLETNQGFEGQGAFIEKFGLMMEQSATLTVSRRRWDQLVGRYGQTLLPNRPSEGDLLYFPLTRGLFEIKFVQHQDPFYQLGKLYVYRLNVELFQYASEHIDTGHKDIDIFESIKTYDTDLTRSASGSISGVTLTNPGFGYTSKPTITVTGGGGSTAVQPAVLEAVYDSTEMTLTGINILDTGAGYVTPPTITISAPPAGGQIATAVATIDANPTLPQAFGENFAFKSEAENFIFNTNNPFGDVVPLKGESKDPNTGIITYLKTMDSTHYYMDSSLITMDNDTGH